MAQNILIVDDDKGYLLATQRMLEAEDYLVTTASSAAEARDRLAERRPDVILLDVLMPVEDGFTFADALSKDDALSAIPVLLVTSIAENPGQVMHAFEQDKGISAVDVLAKSAAHEQLIETVAGVLADE